METVALTRISCSHTLSYAPSENCKWNSSDNAARKMYCQRYLISWLILLNAEVEDELTLYYSSHFFCSKTSIKAPLDISIHLWYLLNARLLILICLVQNSRNLLCILLHLTKSNRKKMSPCRVQLWASTRNPEKNCLLSQCKKCLWLKLDYIYNVNCLQNA